MVYDQYFALFTQAVAGYDCINPADFGNDANANVIKERILDIYDNYSGIFEAAVREYGTESEKYQFVLNSQKYRVQISDVETTVTGYTKLAKKVVELLLINGHRPSDLLKRLGRLDDPIPGFDNNILDNKDSKQAASRYSKGTIRRSGIYVSNQWCAEKAARFIRQLHSHYPTLKIFPIK